MGGVKLVSIVAANTQICSPIACMEIINKGISQRFRRKKLFCFCANSVNKIFN